MLMITTVMKIDMLHRGGFVSTFGQLLFLFPSHLLIVTQRIRFGRHERIRYQILSTAPRQTPASQAL